jgi:hypothetical protein
LHWERFCSAQASISVPSTVTCSSDHSTRARACARIWSKKAWATSPASKRSRLLLNVEGSRLGSSMFNPTNQRNKRLSSSGSISSHSRRMV